MNSVDTTSWIQLESELKEGNMNKLEQVYRLYRNDFIQFAQRYPCSNDEILDCYQDAVLALYENIMHGKITSYSANIKTYLFSIGRYKLIAILKANKKKVEQEQDIEFEGYMEPTIFEEVRNDLLKKAIGSLGETCRKLLVMSYYHGYKNQVLMELLNYKNDQTLRANKSRCLRKLREHMTQKEN